MTKRKLSAKEIVEAYLDKRAQEDPQFAEAYAKPKKNIDECWKFILGEARKQGTSVCMSDEEVFGLAVHYYDEDDIKINHVNGRARVSSTKRVELKEEEKEKIRQEAMEKYKSELIEQQRAINKKNTKNKKASQTVNVGSLFD